MKYIKLFMLLVTIMISDTTLAGHAAGGYFEYTCLGGNTYEVRFIMLRDCGGSKAPPTLTFSLTNSCGTSCGQLSYEVECFSKVNASYGCEVACYTEGSITQLDHPSFERALYKQVITLPYACADWKISTHIVIRSFVDYVETINELGDNYFNYCIINNTSGYCNSSIQYSGEPVALGCVSTMGQSKYHSTNPDGNTIVYSFVNPLAGDCANNVGMTHIGGASIVRPHPALEDFDLNQTNGEFTFFGTMIGKSYFAVRAQEYDGTTLVGETVIDGMTYVQSGCDLGATIDFSDWSGDNDNTIAFPDVDVTYCRTVTLEVNGVNNFNINDISIIEPDYVTHTILSNDNGTAVIEFCVKFPVETICQEVDAAIYISAGASNRGCFANATNSGHTGYYHFTKVKGEYCPTNLYYTKRSPADNPMPTFARAQDTIWVGDKMPSTAPLSILQNTGSVVIEEDITLIAGQEVIMPSCLIPGNGCVTINAGSTIYLKPNICSDSCEQTPIGLHVEEYFDCSFERLQCFAEGDGPFSFTYNVNGTITTTSASALVVHDAVSTSNGGSIPYTVTVQDAGGQTGTFSGSLMGTKRFYEDVRNNTTHYNFPEDIFGNPTTLNGVSGNYYGASIFCVEEHPAYIFDAKNSGPPWYGATSIEFSVRNSWGQQIYYTWTDLAGDNDWSLDNGEIYWNGYINNDIGDSCVYPESDVVAYTLEARNCFTAVHTEAAAFSLDDGLSFHTPGCTSEDSLARYLGTVDHAKSDDGGDDHGNQMNGGHFEDRAIEAIQAANGVFVYAVPNPTSGTFIVKSNQKRFSDVQLLDQAGKVIMNFGTLASEQEINISFLSTGIYTLVLEGSHLKIVKE